MERATCTVEMCVTGCVDGAQVSLKTLGMKDWMQLRWVYNELYIFSRDLL